MTNFNRFLKSTKMKKLALLLAVAWYCSTSYGQYLPGERWLPEGQIPALVANLHNSRTDAQRANALLELGYWYLYKDGEHRNDLDSGLLYARLLGDLGARSHNESLVQEALLLSGILHMEQKDFPAAERLLPAMNDTSRLKLLLCLTIFNCQTAGALYEDNRFLDSAVTYCEMAMKLVLKTKVQLNGTVLALEQIAHQYKRRHLPALAEKYYLLTRNYTDDQGHPAAARVYSNLSILYAGEGNFYKGMEYGLKAEAALHANSRAEDIAAVYNSLGSLSNMQGKPDRVIYYYGKLLADPKRFNITLNMYSVMSGYCNSLITLGRTAEIWPLLQSVQRRLPLATNMDRCYFHLTQARAYEDLKQIGQAEEQFQEAIRYAKLANIADARLYFYLGRLYFDSGAIAKAVEHLRIAAAKLRVENNAIVASNLQYLAKAEAAMGRHQVAYELLVKSKALSDSMFTVGKARLTDELETQYQTSKKEADLRAKEANILLLNNQADARRKITFLVIALLLVIVALLCWLFWSKLRSNKVISDKNTLLQQLVRDKSWLLKEMHHRVKNNLHTIVSLLESQSAYLQDDALEAIQHSQSRVFSMSLIHQKLYQADDNKTVDMADYVPELIDYLKESFSIYRSVRIVMDIDHTAFNVEDAVPLGLIINEAVTNSMKYAFTDGEPGEIRIRLTATTDDLFELVMADNGKGLNKDFDIGSSTSLGFHLIRGLSEQIGAQLQIVNENGVKIIVSGISAYRTIKVKAMEHELKEQIAL